MDRERLTALIGPSRFDSEFENPITKRTDNLMEGLYLRTEAGGVVTGRAKFVRPEFVEKVKQSEHWQHQAMTAESAGGRGGHLVMTWDELSTSTPGDILAWADDQPWCRAMADAGRTRGGIPRGMSGPTRRWSAPNCRCSKSGRASPRTSGRSSCSRPCSTTRASR